MANYYANRFGKNILWHQQISHEKKQQCAIYLLYLSLTIYFNLLIIFRSKKFNKNKIIKISDKKLFGYFNCYFFFFISKKLLGKEFSVRNKFIFRSNSIKTGFIKISDKKIMFT